MKSNNTLFTIEKIKPLFSNIDIKEQIGRGGQKVVFKGEHKKYGSVALKLICPSNKSEQDRALRELLISSQLDTSYFAKIYEYNNLKLEGKNIIYVIEEFIVGESLRERINKNKPNLLPKDEVKVIIESLLKALILTESKHLVHRDIKPENIMISDKRVVLIDFGIARHLDMVSLTETFAVFGPMTPGYAAPEQIKNEKRKISIRTDLFSLGILFYELLTGENPFVCSTVPETLNKTLNYSPIPLINKGFDHSISDFINACLEKSPHRRPASAEIALKLFYKINWEEL